MSGFSGTERYEVQRLLGQGGMGTVYSVFDRRRQRDVALKLLLDSEAGSLFRFKREFRAVADLRHPNLVRLYDLGVLPQGGFFFTMELVDGLDLKAWVERKREESRRTIQVASDGSAVGEMAETKLDLDAGDATETRTMPWAPGGEDGDVTVHVARILGEVVEGLDYLHACRKVHRDLKPSNVMVGADGRAKLLDFGIVRDLDTEGLTVEGAVGTPLYMAPEQIGGEETGPPADAYSLGCILYQLLGGRPPFVGRASRVLMQHLREEPPPLSSLTPDADPRLAGLCGALLRKEPGERPNLAHVREVLAEVSGEAPRATTSIAPPPAEVELLGREPELGRLERAYQGLELGNRVVLVAGESGAGKSALIQEFVRRVPEGVIPWVGGCNEREHVPYKAFDAIVDSVAVELTRRGEAAVRLLPEGTTALTRLFPVLREVEVVARHDPETPLRDAQAERARAGLAFFQLLTNLNGGAPPLMVVEDLQRADPESLDVLSWLTEPDSPPALVIGTYGAEEVGPSHPLQEVLALEGVERLELQPLSREACDRLARQCAGTTLSQTQLERLAEDAAGNPYLVVELARAAAQLSADALPTVDELVGERLRALEEVPQRVVEVAAVAGGRADFTLLATVAEVEPAPLADALDELLRVQLLREVPGHHGEDAYDLLHNRLRQAVYEQLEPERRAALHRALASRLAEAGEPARAVEHYRLGGEAESAREAALAAAREAESLLAFDQAAELYALALPSEVDLSEPAQLEVAAARGYALAKAGRHHEAALAFEEAAPAAPPERGRELLLEAATRRIAAGDVEEGIAGFQFLLARYGHQIRPGLLRNGWTMLCRFVLLFVGWWVWDTFGRFRPAKVVGRPPRRPPTPEELFELRLYDRVHQCLTVARPLEAAVFGVLHAQRSRRYDEPTHQGRARIGYALFMAGEFGGLARSRVRHHLEIGEALCSEAGDGQGLLTGHMTRAYLGLIESNWTAVQRASEQARELARRRGLFGEPNLALIENIHLGAGVFRGQPDEVLDQASEYIASARARGNVAGVAWPSSMLGFVLLWLGQRERAGHVFKEALACTPERPLTVLRLHVELEALALELYDEDVEGGFAKLEDLERRWRSSGLIASSLENAAYRLTLARFRLLRALRGGEVEGCQLTQGLRRLLPTPKSIEEEMLRLRGALAYHRGQHRKALRLLDSAVARCEYRNNELGRAIALIGRGKVRAALGFPGANYDRQRGLQALAALGCEDTYLLRIEGWEEPAPA